MRRRGSKVAADCTVLSSAATPTYSASVAGEVDVEEACVFLNLSLPLRRVLESGSLGASVDDACPSAVVVDSCAPRFRPLNLERSLKSLIRLAVVVSAAEADSVVEALQDHPAASLSRVKQPFIYSVLSYALRKC
jgi:hypothetical protein